jgi:hypothetical protein
MTEVVAPETIIAPEEFLNLERTELEHHNIFILSGMCQL